MCFKGRYKYNQPVNVVSRMGRLPNLSDQGPRNRLAKAGIMLSSRDVVIMIFAEYVCTITSIS